VSSVVRAELRMLAAKGTWDFRPIYKSGPLGCAHLRSHISGFPARGSTNVGLRKRPCCSQAAVGLCFPTLRNSRGPHRDSEPSLEKSIGCCDSPWPTVSRGKSRKPAPLSSLVRSHCEPFARSLLKRCDLREGGASVSGQFTASRIWKE